MKVLFVDVGQGTCQVILLGDRRAIVIDTGSNAAIAHRILKLNKINTIELLAVSHSHYDHSGGAVATKKNRGSKKSKSGVCATGILIDYQDSIKQIGFVQDANFVNSSFGKYLAWLLMEGKVKEDQLVRLERTNHFWPLWPIDGTKESKTLLTCISPTAAGNIIANTNVNINAASAIIELRHKNDRIIFTGDSEYSQWEALMEHRKLKGIDGPILCKAMTMPHHGGLMKGSESDLQRFANETTDAEVTVFSVGTTNGHKHPRPEVVKAMHDSGAHVICTQITTQCCTDLESVRPAVIGSLVLPCRSNSKPEFQYKYKKRGAKKVRLRRSRNVACAGTIEASLDENGIEITCLEEHSQRVDTLVSSGHMPLCRR